MDEKSKPEDIRFGARVTASRYEYDSNPERWHNYAEAKLRNNLTHIIQIEMGDIIITDNMVEGRIDLYVARPETFWSIVRKEAEKMLQFMPRNI